MTSIKNLKAAKKFGPGYFIREQMEIRGWVQEELADVLEISPKHLNSILQDKQALNIESAKKLGSAFGTSPQYWLNLDNDYRLWLDQRQKEQTSIVEIKANIYGRMPIRDMVKKGWIAHTNDNKELVKAVKEYLDVSDLDFRSLEESLAPFFCKKSEAYNQFNASYAATWFLMAKRISANYPVKEFDKQALEKLYNRLSTYTTQDNGIELFLNELNSCGVKFFVLPHLEKTYLDGAAFIQDGSPVVVYTSRYKRIDNFWFTVAHEIAHVLKHLNDKNPVVLDNLQEVTTDIKEQEANTLAVKQLKHPEIIAILKPYFSYLSLPRIQECAKVVNIHPSIIIGALAFNKTISFRKINLFNQNVLELIPKKYIHDSVFV